VLATALAAILYRSGNQAQARRWLNRLVLDEEWKYTMVLASGWGWWV
jgi:hypothetical protein